MTGRAHRWLGCLLALIAGAAGAQTSADGKVRAGMQRLTPALASAGFRAGDPVFIRIFKMERELEVWLQADADTGFTLFKTYPICSYSGALGPKTRQGDGQAPEGFYQVGKSQLNPYSSYHLSFNLGYPNAYERAQGWTGNYLMVHGDCVSIGCYAMTDRGIEEIYALVSAALDGGQAKVDVHAYPFRFVATNLATMDDHPQRDFWSQLRLGYEGFERTGLPPRISVERGRYRVTP